jgi:cytochrome c553
VHRRPLSAEQVDAYLGLFAAGAGAYAGLGAFESGARLVLEAMFQSPFFLYRIEGSGGAEDGQLRLDAYELASRLSYSLWDSLPDAALFARAESGELLEPGVVAHEAERMLSDARAAGVVLAFHAQLFEADRLSHVAPSPSVYPEVSEHLARSAERERNLFIEYQVLERDGSYKDLLDSSETFVDAELARVYGLPGEFGSAFAKVSLDPKERRGLLTQVAFLASHATSVDPDPIHRGVFIARRVLCKELSAPPNLPPLPAANGRTNRQTVEAHTEKAGTSCSACHKSTINPLGFPFETYDAVGRKRSLDAGLPVDSSSVASIDGAKVAVKDGVELADALANSQQAHTCYARRWLEYAYGRPSTVRDEALVERLGQASRAGLSVKRLIVELVSAPAFAVTQEADLR